MGDEQTPEKQGWNAYFKDVEDHFKRIEDRVTELEKNMSDMWGCAI